MPYVHDRSRRGLTLIELLVCLVVIGMIVAMFLPALSNARRTSRTTKALSDVKQYAFALTSYTSTHAEALPFFAVEQRPELGTVVDGVNIHPNYFYQSFYVIHSLVPDFAPVELQTGSRVSGNGWIKLRSQGFRINRILLTHAAAADAEYWRDDDPPLGTTFFRKQSTASCAFPSQKVSLYNSEHSDPSFNYGSRGSWMGALFDGSATIRTWTEPIPTSNPRPLGAFPALGMSTRNGLRGVDW